MIREGKRRLGNEGSAFVVVLICMLVIGIIADDGSGHGVHIFCGTEYRNRNEVIG